LPLLIAVLASHSWGWIARSATRWHPVFDGDDQVQTFNAKLGFRLACATVIDPDKN
jgi:hypothetical protein